MQNELNKKDKIILSLRKISEEADMKEVDKQYSQNKLNDLVESTEALVGVTSLLWLLFEKGIFTKSEFLQKVDEVKYGEKELYLV